MTDWLQLKQQDALVVELKNIITRQEQEKATLEEEVGKSRIAIKELSTREYEAAQEADKMAEDIEGLVRKLADAESTSDATIRKLQSQNAELTEKLTTAITDKDQLTSINESHEVDKVALERQVEVLTSEINSLKEEAESSEMLHNENNTSNILRIEQLTSQVSQLQDELNQQEAMCEKMSSGKNDLQLQLREATNQNKELVDDIHNLESIRSALEESQSLLQRQNSEKDQIIETLLNDVKQAEERILQNDSSKQQSDERIKQLSQTANDLQQENATLLTNTKALQEKVHIKESELSKVNAIVGNAMDNQEIKSSGLQLQKAVLLNFKNDCIRLGKYYRHFTLFRLSKKNIRSTVRTSQCHREASTSLMAKNALQAVVSRYYHTWRSYYSSKKSAETSEVLQEVTTILNNVSGMNDLVGSCRVVGELRNELSDSSAMRKELQQEFLETTGRLQEAIKDLTNEIVFLTSSRSDIISSLWELHKLSLSLRNELSLDMSPENLTRAICSASNATEKTNWLISTYLSDTEKSILAGSATAAATPASVDKNSGTPPPSRGMHRHGHHSRPISVGDNLLEETTTTTSPISRRPSIIKNNMVMDILG